MIPLVTEMSVDKKIRRRMSVLVGNYEFYYAAGLAQPILSFDCDGSEKPYELEKIIRACPETDDTLPDEPEVSERRYLMYLIARYDADEDYDDAMKSLFDEGVKSSPFVGRMAEKTMNDCIGMKGDTT